MVTQYFLKNLNDLIEKSGLNQLQLSKRLGIPQGTVNNWFRRNSVPPIETVEILAKFFNVEPYYLFMAPGTQGDARPANRSDDFKTLLDDLAVKCLTEVELASYKEMGPEEFVRVLRINYESDHILPVRWCLKLNAELKKYVSVNLEEKLRSNLAAQDAKKA